jgi:hypothetical protein
MTDREVLEKQLFEYEKMKKQLNPLSEEQEREWDQAIERVKDELYTLECGGNGR